MLLDSRTGALTVEKVSSTPANPALGVLDGVQRLLAQGIEPIAPQSRTKDMAERVDFQGNVLVPLDEADVRRAAPELRAAGAPKRAASR
jgi:N-methylhydantoinase A/oxoprolinase/acetone carboxylase beta subunit